MRVNEIFESIQGEGVNMGRRCTFVRFAGCNMKCDFCDTQHESFTEMSVEQIAERLDSKPLGLVVLTGGEPLLQADLEPLIRKLTSAGHEVALETNGTINAPWLSEYDVHVACSPKGETLLDHLFISELKYVITDGFEKLENISEFFCTEFAGRIWLQPCSQNQESMNKCFELAMSDPRLRVGVQLHKVLGVE
jgi:organic radical activating enzyme